MRVRILLCDLGHIITSQERKVHLKKLKPSQIEETQQLFFKGSNFLCFELLSSLFHQLNLQFFLTSLLFCDLHLTFSFVSISLLLVEVNALNLYHNPHDLFPLFISNVEVIFILLGLLFKLLNSFLGFLKVILNSLLQLLEEGKSLLQFVVVLLLVVLIEDRVVAFVVHVCEG